MTDQTRTILPDPPAVIDIDVKQHPYTDAWWWSADGGQRIARIMMEMMQHNDNTKAHYSHDFVVMVAKAAYEFGYNNGHDNGFNDGYGSCEQYYNPDGLD